MRSFICSLLMTLTSMASTARADFDVAPYAQDGKLMTGGHDDVLGLDNVNERVFGYAFNEDPSDPFIIGDPGFNNGTFGIGVFPNNGLLPTFSTLGIKLIGNLQYWDGQGSVAFGAAPANVDLGITRGSTTVHIAGDGISGTVPTIGSTAAAGRLHVHVQSTLNFAGSDNSALPNAPDGIYMFGLQLTLPGSGLADSDPFYFVYKNDTAAANLGTEGSLDLAQDAAQAWIEANLLVPEPASWVLASISACALVAVSIRRRRSRD